MAIKFSNNIGMELYFKYASANKRLLRAITIVGEMGDAYDKDIELGVVDKKDFEVYTSSLTLNEKSGLKAALRGLGAELDERPSVLTVTLPETA